MNYEAWRITFQSSEAAARSAFARCAELEAEIARLQPVAPCLGIASPARRKALEEADLAYWGIPCGS